MIKSVTIATIHMNKRVGAHCLQIAQNVTVINMQYANKARLMSNPSMVFRMLYVWMVDLNLYIKINIGI